MWYASNKPLCRWLSCSILHRPPPFLRLQMTPFINNYYKLPRMQFSIKRHNQFIIYIQTRSFILILFSCVFKSYSVLKINYLHWLIFWWQWYNLSDTKLKATCMSQKQWNSVFFWHDFPSDIFMLNNIYFQ